MISVETMVSFTAASALLALVPGPDNIFVLTQSALQGRRAGIMVMLGLCTGLIFHSTAVAMGVAVIFQTSALAFSILKYLGAAYLVYLAWLSFTDSDEVLNTARANGLNLGRLYRRGIIMNITNPKVSIFFLAFLPQFADPTRGPVWMQMLLLGGLFICATFFVFGGIALLAGSIGAWLNRSPWAQSLMNKGASLVFLGLALKLAATEQ